MRLGESHLPAALQGPHEGGVVGVLQVAAHGDAVGQAGDPHLEGLEQAGLVAMMTSSTPPAATRSTRDLMCRSSGPTWFMGEMTPWSTWYNPRYSRERSMATTSLGSATTQITELSRRGLEQMEQGPSPSVRFWHTGQQ